MRRVKEKIYDYLYSCQQRCGGYTGKDIEELARHLDLNRKTIKRDLKKWITTDPLFAELKYIGKRSIPITLEEIAVLNQLLSENITIGRQELIKLMLIQNALLLVWLLLARILVFPKWLRFPMFPYKT